MGLVDYSDSDASDASDHEDASVAKTNSKVSKPTPNSTKPAFQKVVDASNPGKIRVSLPTANIKDEITKEQPPAKRLKTGGGGKFSGFNSFLPAPKRTGPASGAVGGNSKTSPAGAFSFKTGAAPGFDRSIDASDEVGNGSEALADNQAKEQPTPSIATSKPAEEVKLVGKPLMFRPLSVARKPAKKKKSTAANGLSPSTTSSTSKIEVSSRPADAAPPKPKVSLFSMSEESVEVPPTSSTHDYEPIVYESEKSEVTEEYPNNSGFYMDEQSSTLAAQSDSQSLATIASDLNLSAAEKRRLFGRQKGGMETTATKIINFNTDDEWRHNEELRAAGGDQVQHNPVRAIAPGKHSIRQLINAAVNQKDALEESFAKGKSNRAEAGSKYGW